MTSQPYIQVGVADALSRIEAKIDGIFNQMMLKADAAVVHDLDTRVRLLEKEQASQAAVAKALARARASIWVAIGSLATGVSAVGYTVVITRGR